MELGYFIEFLPKAAPLGIGLLASHMRALGEDVHLWDLNVTKMSAEDITRIAPDGGRGVVFGLSCLTANVGQGYQLSKTIRALAPQTKIIYGGVHPTAMPGEPLEKGFADAVVRGEGEETLPALIQKWRQGESPIGQPGITCRDESGTIIHGPPAPLIEDLNRYPGFPYDMIDISRYNLGLVATSRGCPFDCIFCSQRLITGRRFKFRSTENVIGELDFLINDCGQKSIMFVDDLFTGNKARVIELCHEIRKREFNKKCHFGAQVRADGIDHEILSVLKESGFKNLAFGIETSSEKLMAFINKKETLSHIVEKVRMANSYGLITEGVFILGFPGETLNDRLRAVKLAQEMALGRVRFNNLTPYPGTHVYQIAKDEGRLTIEEGWTNFNSAGATSSKIGSRFTIPYVPEGTTSGALQGEILLCNMYTFVKRLLKMITANKEPSGIGFELSMDDLLKPKKIAMLFMAFATVVLRTGWFICTERECRSFLFHMLRNAFPLMDQQVQEALISPIPPIETARK